MQIKQEKITLNAKNQGFHLITNEIISQLDLSSFNKGLCHIFIQHTSASLALNENADPSVRNDLSLFFDSISNSIASKFTHTQEGPDDMPAHINSILIGNSLSLPIKDARLSLGIWQGIYLCEHRLHMPIRTLVITYFGQSYEN